METANSALLSLHGKFLFVCLFVFLIITVVGTCYMLGPVLSTSMYVCMYVCIYLFMAVLGLRFCARAFSSCGKRGPLFIAVRGPLTIAASLVAEHRLQSCRLSSCGSRAQLLRSMWDLPRPGLEPVSPALAGRLSTTAPPGKPLNGKLLNHKSNMYHARNFGNQKKKENGIPRKLSLSHISFLLSTFSL